MKNIMTEMKIARFDPDTNQEATMQGYQVPLEGSILDALRYVYEQYDSTLSFRFGCAGPGTERCGACCVLANGVSCYSCKMMFHENMTIEPHPKFVLLKDLTVDFDQLATQRRPYLSSVQISIDADRCDGCRRCVSTCAMKVLEMRKENGKVTAFPADPSSCCGLGCRQCAIFCKNHAIQLVEVH